MSKSFLAQCLYTPTPNNNPTAGKRSPVTRFSGSVPSQALPRLTQPRLATIHPTARLRTRVTLSVVSKPSQNRPCLAPSCPAVPGLKSFRR